MANTKFQLTALDSQCNRVLRGSLPKMPTYTFRGSDNRLPSHHTGSSFVASKVTKIYTGDQMLGVATMHKSNSVPVFNPSDAVDISHMRR